MSEALIPLAQTRGIRLRCPCGAEATVPIPAFHAPQSCFNCGKPWPSSSLLELAGMLGWVKEASGSGKVSVELLLVGPDAK
jgi:hypothetical protein